MLSLTEAEVKGAVDAQQPAGEFCRVWFLVRRDIAIAFTSKLLNREQLDIFLVWKLPSGVTCSCQVATLRGATAYNPGQPGIPIVPSVHVDWIRVRNGVVEISFRNSSLSFLLWDAYLHQVPFSQLEQPKAEWVVRHGRVPG